MARRLGAGRERPLRGGRFERPQAEGLRDGYPYVFPLPVLWSLWTLDARDGRLLGKVPLGSIPLVEARIGDLDERGVLVHATVPPRGFLGLIGGEQTSFCFARS